MATRRAFLAEAGALALPLLAAGPPSPATAPSPGPAEGGGLPADWSPAAAGSERAQDALASLYDVDRTIANFDAAYYGALTRRVHAAYLDRIAFVNRHNSAFLRGAVPPGPVAQAFEEARAGVAGLLGCAADEVALCPSGTDALTALIAGYRPLRAGESVVYADVDYDEMQHALDWLAASRGAHVVRFALPEPATTANVLAAYEAVLARAVRPKLLLLTHLSNRHGLVPPVAEIVRLARARGVDVILDSAQAVGHVPFTVAETGADFIGFSLHKWVGAPLGTGGIYVRRERLGDVAPYLGNRIHPEDDVRARVSTGTADFAARLTIPAALALQREIGLAAKYRHLVALRNAWVDRVRHLPGLQVVTPDEPGRFGAVAAFRLAGMRSWEDARRVQQRLVEKHRVLAVAKRGLANGPVVRVTPGLYTRAEELDRLVAAITAEHRMFG